MKRTKLLLFLGVLILLLFFYLNGKKNKSIVEKNGVYTIFYIDKVVDGRGLPQISFHYFYEGKMYRGQYPCSSVSMNEMKGNMIFGKVIPFTDDYYTCCYCEVPKNLKVPQRGWSELPDGYCTENESKCF